MENYNHNYRAAMRRLAGAYAPNTLKSYYADTNAFVDWCFVKNIEPFPLTSGGVRKYIEAMAVNYSYASIRRRLSCLRRINKLLGHTDNTQTEEVYLIRHLPRRHLRVLRDQSHDLQTDLSLLLFAPTSQNDT